MNSLYGTTRARFPHISGGSRHQGLLWPLPILGKYDHPFEGTCPDGEMRRRSGGYVDEERTLRCSIAPHRVSGPCQRSWERRQGDFWTTTATHEHVQRGHWSAEAPFVKIARTSWTDQVEIDVRRLGRKHVSKCVYCPSAAYSTEFVQALPKGDDLVGSSISRTYAGLSGEWGADCSNTPCPDSR